MPTTPRNAFSLALGGLLLSPLSLSAQSAAAAPLTEPPAFGGESTPINVIEYQVP